MEVSPESNFKVSQEMIWIMTYMKRPLYKSWKTTPLLQNLIDHLDSQYQLKTSSKTIKSSQLKK